VIGLTPILTLGITVLAFGVRLLVQWTRRRHAPVVSIEDYSRACLELDSVLKEMAAMRRIFANDDLEFVLQSGTEEVQRFFLEERKILAIQWLRTIQRQMAGLMELHLKLASLAHAPNPKFEFKLSTDYVCFIFVSNLLLFLLWLRGPFETVLIVGYTLRVSESLSSVFALRLKQTDRIGFSPEEPVRLT
jgi:hypothetical protein